MPLRIGTRASALAQWQADWVAARLRAMRIEVELVPISTAGDRRGEAIGAIGAQGVFTKEIQSELLAGRIDLAVHSLKDLPTTTVPGLLLAAVPERGEPGDVLVSADGALLDELPAGAKIGTGSPRRRAQLLHYRNDLEMRPLRGNVDTRLRKLRAGEFDAVVLAEAGLVRLGLADRITQRLPFDVTLPSPGQGALGLEVREDDAATGRIVAALDCGDSRAAVTAERTMLLTLEGGCLAPVAALGQVENGRLRLVGRVLDVRGARSIESAAEAPPSDAESLGRQVAESLLAKGAGELIRSAHTGCNTAIYDRLGSVDIFNGDAERFDALERLKELEQAALLDELTGLANRRFFNRAFDACLANFKRTGTSFGLSLIDIDHFKQFNDTYGHDAGDDVLRMVARTLSRNCRHHDTLARWGGEEFAVISEQVGDDAIFGIADRLRVLVAKSSLARDGKPLSVTVSVGCCVARPSDDVESLFKRADAGLYESKRRGRNRTTLAE